MATVYTKLSQKNPKGFIFAPGKDEKSGLYFVFALRENYDNRAKGGIRKSWWVVKGSEKGLTLEQFRSLFEKKVGRKLYS